MNSSKKWAILYSAPEDSPQELTTSSHPVRHSRSLLPRALERAEESVPADNVVVTVLEKEQPWWARSTSDLPDQNVTQQPLDRGSGIGILLSLIRIFRRDPSARVVIYASDHVDDDVQPAVDAALEAVGRDPDAVFLLGRCPTTAQIRSNPVWLVPAERAHGLDRGLRGAGPARLSSLVFEPSARARGFLREQGALAAAPVAVTSVRAALQLFERSHPFLVEQFMTRLSGDALFDPGALDELYPFLTVVDFFRDVLGQAPHMVKAWPVASQRTTWAADTAPNRPESVRSVAV